jgi:four helix bundle protein
MPIRRFEELESWRVARTLANLVYELTKQDSFRKDFGRVDPMRRAAVSIMNNIAEGYERGSNKDFAKFRFIARGSAGEVRSMLYLANDQEYLSREQFEDALGLAVRGSELCWGMIKHLQRHGDWKTGMAPPPNPPLPPSTNQPP